MTYKILNIIKAVSLCLLCPGFTACIHETYATPADRHSQRDISIYSDYQDLEKESQKLDLYDVMVNATKYFSERSDIDKGALWLRVAVSRYSDDLSPEEMNLCAMAHTNLGYYWIFERNNPYEAYPLLIKTLKIAEDNDIDTNIVSAANTNIAKIYTIFKDYPKAMQYYKKAFGIACAANHPFAVPYSFIDLIHFAWTADSLPSIRKEIKMIKAAGLPDESMCAYARLMTSAAEHHLNGAPEEAARLVDRALEKMNPEVDDRRYIFHNRMIAAGLALETRNFDIAARNLEAAEAHVANGNLQDLHPMLYRKKTEYYNARGDREAAKECSEEATRFTDSLLNIQAYSQIRDIESSWQANYYDEKLSEQRSETRKWLLFASTTGVLTLLIICLLIFIIRKNRILRQTNENLFKKNVEILNSGKNPHPVANVSEPSLTVETDKSALSPGNEGSDGCEKPADDEDNMNLIYEKAIDYMNNSADIYDTTFTLESMARATGIKSRVISKAINAMTGKNFNTLLGEYRVREACRQMLSVADNEGRPTIEALAYGVGYSSRTHFMRVFKQITGLTTTEFLKQAKNNPHP